MKLMTIQLINLERLSLRLRTLIFKHFIIGATRNQLRNKNMSTTQQILSTGKIRFDLRNQQKLLLKIAAIKYVDLNRQFRILKEFIETV